MKRSTQFIALVSVVFAGSVAIANVPGPSATPSARVAIETEVKPAEGQSGHFVVTSVITDLETNGVVGRPKLVVESGKQASVRTGAEGKWMYQIDLIASGSSKRATYEATFTREGAVISRQRFSVDLNG